ncbi:MAG: hypothetical protein FJX66_05510 [Alphaproteobacteria bacterium]|nr:hypothetical protein [Alphaproteobacteria bacterium]
MKINPVPSSDRQYVQRYAVGTFRVSGVDFSGSIIVFPERTRNWPVQRFEDMDLEALASVFEAAPNPELLLIGCGKRGAMIAEPIRQALRARKITFETMDTGAACRTYNVLMSDGRRVAAALIALQP